jgi:hypothetical protein
MSRDKHLKDAKIQFRHGSGAKPERSVRIAQTRLRVPACSNSNCCRQAQVLGDQQRPRPESGRKGPDWKAHHLSGAKYGLESLALPKDSPVLKGTKYTNGRCPPFPACDDPGTLRWARGRAA